MSVEDQSPSLPLEPSSTDAEPRNVEGGTLLVRSVDLSNGWIVTVLGVIVWIFITALNVVSTRHTGLQTLEMC